jgi:hypothetical protein
MATVRQQATNRAERMNLVTTGSFSDSGDTQWFTVSATLNVAHTPDIPIPGASPTRLSKKIPESQFVSEKRNKQKPFDPSQPKLPISFCLCQ